MMNKNNLAYWFPKIKDLGIPVPKTKIIPVDREDEVKLILSEIPPKKIIKKYAEKIRDAVKELGLKYPIFLRTGHFSGKHYFIKTCFVENKDIVEERLSKLVEASNLASIVPLPIECFVVREFIEVDWKFKAFFGLPIAPERRYFIKDGKVLCHHPYWPEDAFWFGCEHPENWRELLKEINKETEEEIKLLTEYAQRVAKVLDGFWSIDFVRARSGVWYLIDMALGKDSWHPPECKYSDMKKEEKEESEDRFIFDEIVDEVI